MKIVKLVVMVIMYWSLLFSFLDNRTKMNMKLPAYLQDEVEDLAPFDNDGIDFSEFEWMADQELEEFDREVWSAACF